MQFTSVQDINAPLDFVFEQISDFESFEAYAMRVGAQVERKDSLVGIGTGMCWFFEGEFRGKTRAIDIELTDFSPDKQLKFLCQTSGVRADINLQVMPLTKKQTRIKSIVDTKALSISARLVMQSARLAKNSLNRKYNHRFWEFSNYIENNYNQSLR